MNKRTFFSIAVAAVATLFLAGLLLATQVTCPVDDMVSYFTGTTKTMDGRMFYQYRCPRQHTFWVRSDQQ